MEQASISSKKKKDTTNNNKQVSNIIRGTLLIFGFLIYFVFISPLVEKTISEEMVKGLRSKKETTLNYLTPLHNSNVFAQEYNINTIATKNSLDSINSLSQFQTKDPRIVAMEKFLIDYNSPMAPFASVFINEADTYGLDWRLVASISGVESAFGNIIPINSNNGWGWRGGPGGDWSRFPTWGDGIATVTKGLALGYGTDLTPFDIEPTYCPPCGRNPAHVWANGVTRFMNELTYYTKNLDNL